MAFEMLEFTKNWKNHQDFPTYEDDEEKVRADLQLLHDETRSGLNRLVAALNDSGAAANLPFQPGGGLTAQTVQDAIAEVYAAIRGSATGTLVDGSVTREKLAKALLDRVYGGRVWVSMDLPGSQHSPDGDFPVGQLWLRPHWTAENLALPQWTVTGGTAAADSEGWLLTADGSAAELTAVQLLEQVGSPGDRVLVCLWVGDLDDHLSALTLQCGGEMHDLSAGGGVYDGIVSADGSLRLEITGKWPYAETDASFRVQKLLAVNVTAAEAALPGCKGLEDWPGFLEGLATFDTLRLERKLFVQVYPGQWVQIDHECLPVSRGGTGFLEAAKGDLLLGSGGDRLHLLAVGEEDSVLQIAQGQPAWVPREQLITAGGFLRSASGFFAGDGVNGRTVTLPVAPKVIVLYQSGTDQAPLVLCDGARIAGTFTVLSSNQMNNISYQAYAALNGSTLTFTCDSKTSVMGSTPQARLANEPGVTQFWVALY